jgi:hypothetical protein
MRELSRNRPEGHLWFTRAQLGAMGAIAVSAAALTFFLGVMVGRSAVPEPAAATGRIGLIAPEVVDDSLAELLARVEAATIQEAHAGQLTFPDQLPTDEPGSLVPDLAPEAPGAPFIAEAGEAAQAPPDLSELPELPVGSWSVEVGSYADADAARALVDELVGEGVEAWRAETLEQGATHYRVRVGAWSSKAEAAEALGELRASLDRDDLFVTSAR